MTRPLSLRFALGFVATLAACSNSPSTSNQAQGYLSSDPCALHTDQTSCNATERGCRWLEQEIATEPTLCDSEQCTKAQPGICVSNSPCFALDQSGCQGNGACAWAAITSLCPMGATCTSTGFCHPKDDSGTDCACVSPLSCPSDGECKAVECDCSGGGGQGGTGSGGACSCACAPCAPGEDCKPCACNCDDGGPECVYNGGGTSDGPPPLPGTMDGGVSTDSDTPQVGGASGACDCACAPCVAGSSCPPCICNCPAISTGPSTGTGGGTKGGCIPPSAPSGPTTPPAPTTPNGNPPTRETCAAIACTTLCANGYAKDKNGCDTCQCLL